MVVVAATFQKDPQILMAHPDQGFETLADLKRHPILISQDARTTYWEWLKTDYGFSDDMIRPGLFPSDLELSRAYTLRFVNHKVGMDLKPQ
jgi:NitT/TauT family transport system substrate-binding protein